MYHIFLLAEPSNRLRLLVKEIDQAGLSYQIGNDLSAPVDPSLGPATDAVLIDLSSLGTVQTRLVVDQCRDLKLPAVVVVLQEQVYDYDPSLNPDEFILCPLNPGELLVRIQQAIYRVRGPAGQEILKVADLVIDLEKYDVSLAGRRISLTYKEFQLLVLLASNPGRVYSREVLLSQVWGYDYLGGTRTVDVHIRRLRSKIEDPDHCFVETIWNVGYRFKTFPDS
ncbi:MAG TPA: response regulator transcription factor [Dehalococcoidia bacterium]|nr:response regulator transcription factor [Dehalococcoidia bacterium]